MRFANTPVTCLTIIMSYQAMAVVPPPSVYAGQIALGTSPYLETRTRAYAPNLGLFLSPDPLVLRNPDLCLDSLINCNLYAYAENSPADDRDPSGLWPDGNSRTRSSWAPVSSWIRSGNPRQTLLRVVGVAAAGYSAFVVRNLLQQHQVHQGTRVPAPHTRLAALKATERFPKGTVGHGAQNGISLVHATLGNFGQARIGDLFRSPEAQQTMAQPITSAGNLKLGQMEHAYWATVYKSAQTPGDKFGGFVGSSFSPPVRASIQSVADKFSWPTIGRSSNK